jgi:hypothetical protein
MRRRRVTKWSKRSSGVNHTPLKKSEYFLESLCVTTWFSGLRRNLRIPIALNRNVLAIDRLIERTQFG